MSREKKAETIDRLQEVFTKCSIGILTDYRGLSTPELTILRRKLGEAKGEYKVVKNTLARFAAKRTGKDDLVGLLEGPVAIVFGYGEVAEPARVLADYIRASKTDLSIKGGFLSDRLLTPADVATLATLPSREVLLAKVLGGFNSPITGLVNCLASPMRGFMGILQARIKQMEEEQNAGK